MAAVRKSGTPLSAVLGTSSYFKAVNGCILKFSQATARLIKESVAFGFCRAIRPYMSRASRRLHMRRRFSKGPERPLQRTGGTPNKAYDSPE